MFWPFSRRRASTAGDTAGVCSSNDSSDDIAMTERDIEMPESTGNSRTDVLKDLRVCKRQSLSDAGVAMLGMSGTLGSDGGIETFRRSDGLPQNDPSAIINSKQQELHGRPNGPLKQTSLPKMAWNQSEPHQMLQMKPYHEGPREDGNVLVYRAKRGNAIQGPSPRCGGKFVPTTTTDAAAIWLPQKQSTERQASDELGADLGSNIHLQAMQLPPKPPIYHPHPQPLVDAGVPLQVPQIICHAGSGGHAEVGGHAGSGGQTTGTEILPRRGLRVGPTAVHPWSPDAPLPPPCAGLRPGPPSTSGMRTESFTSGTSGRLLRPGVGIGAGTMREAHYCDLRLIQQIGEGGFGKVYYGHWCGAPVAIKMANTHKEEDMQRQLQEFQREVTNMCTIPPHGNVLKLLAACLEPPHLALVTEFCSRGSLYNALHTPGAPPMQRHQLLATWLGIARGMNHLHSCRVLHRDLKSANLLIDDMGSVKIGDFGLSKLCSKNLVNQAMTGALGTYQWMAPEVLTSQRYSEKADVYSFGMVMWECLSRKLPYEGRTAMQAGLGVATMGLRPEIPPDSDPLHAELIRACWAPVADQRPSFSQIISRLEDMLTMLDSQRSSLSCVQIHQEDSKEQDTITDNKDVYRVEDGKQGSGRGCTADDEVEATTAATGTSKQPQQQQQQVLLDTLPGLVPESPHGVIKMHLEQRQWLKQDQGIGQSPCALLNLVGPRPVFAERQ